MKKINIEIEDDLKNALETSWIAPKQNKTTVSRQSSIFDRNEKIFRFHEEDMKQKGMLETNFKRGGAPSKEKEEPKLVPLFTKENPDLNILV